jgi:3-deoxy-D-manno-octulosonic-acid transferase
MWRILYQVLLPLAYPLVRLRLLWRARREPEYGRRIPERLGRVPASVPRGAIWFHTVSAGETIAAAPIIDRLLGEFPESDFLVTTMTPTGSEQVIARLGGRVAHCYAPYDFRGGVERFFDAVAPRLLVIFETELWPNLLEAAARRGIPVDLVNARLSERSARGYARIGALTRRMLGQLQHIACQYPAHGQRFVALGAQPGRVSVLGSVKFDLCLPDDHGARCAELARRWRLEGRPVWIAGSTNPGEDAPVLAAHDAVRSACPGACLLLVPRHPSRAVDLEKMVQEAGFSVIRQSAAAGAQAEVAVDVVIGDVMGQLLYLYGLSQAAFIGGSLVPVGGHNPIEPALCGQPLLTGPHTFNFPDVVAAFEDSEALLRVGDAAGLAAEVSRCLGDAELRGRMAASARRVVAANTGATERLLALLREHVGRVAGDGPLS